MLTLALMNETFLSPAGRTNIVVLPILMATSLRWLEKMLWVF